MACFREVKRVIVNWFYGNEGEEFTQVSIKHDNVNSILYHEPEKDDKEHYVDVYYKDGEVQRHFNLNTVVLAEPDKEEEIR